MPNPQCLQPPQLRIPCLSLNSGASGLTIAQLAQLVAPFVTAGPSAEIIDQKAQGTNGGTFTSGAWQTRDLNVINFDPFSIISGLAADQVTLDSGIWSILALPPALSVNRHMSRIQNITLGTTITFGQSTDSGATQNVSISNAVVTLTDPLTVIEIQHQCGINGANTGFGRAVNFAGAPELYTIVQFTKLVDIIP